MQTNYETNKSFSSSFTIPSYKAIRYAIMIHTTDREER